MNRFLMTILAVSITASTQTRIPLIEEFSSSTCPPCKTFNETIFTPFLNNTANAGKFTCVNFRMNWPGTGDPYYTAEGGTRKSLYSITGVPDCYIDGTAAPDAAFNSLSGFNTAFNSAAAKAAKATITSIHQITGETPATGAVAVAVTVTTTQDISNGYLFVALYEKKTTKNVSTNGEKEFHHVMMKMIPNASGTALTLKANTPVTVTKTASLSGTHIEEMTDLEVVVWVQINGTKEVLQSAWSVVGNTEIAMQGCAAPKQVFFARYLTSEKCIQISNARNSRIELYNLSGMQVLSVTGIKEVFKLGTAQIAPGRYLLTVRNAYQEASVPIMLY